MYENDEYNFSKPSALEVLNVLEDEELTELMLQEFPDLFRDLHVADKEQVWGMLTSRLLEETNKDSNLSSSLKSSFVQVTSAPSIPEVELMCGVLRTASRATLLKLYFKLFSSVSTPEDKHILLARMQERKSWNFGPGDLSGYIPD
jgi:hypothetical protein